MPVFEPHVWLLLAPTLVYSSGVVLVAVWRRRAVVRAPPAADGDLPRLAVLVAARNEEDNLPRCLEALLAQDYPAGRLAVYVADDHSTDGTPAVVERFQGWVARPSGVPADDSEWNARPAPNHQIHLVDVPEPTDRLRGKALAIHSAIEAADEDIFLMTDADCAPSPSWARTMATYLSDSKVGVVTAETVVDRDAETPSRALAAIQTLDWRYLLSGSAFLIENGRPITAMGNNMGFRREAYAAAGGYPALQFSVTEDYLLFKTIVEKTPWRARFPIDDRLLVRTLALGSLVEVYAQRRRWARGGLRAPASSYLLYVLAHLAHVLPLIALFVALLPAALVLGLKMGADFMLVRLATTRHEHAELWAFPLWEIYLFWYAGTLPASLLLAPRIKWKGRRL